MEAFFRSYQEIAKAHREIVSGRRNKIHRPPGARLDSFASSVFSKRTYATVLKPCLGDMLAEYLEALHEGKPNKARWIRVRGTAAFWGTVVLQMPVSATKLIKRIWTVSGG
jgi:hypothetical protein